MKKNLLIALVAVGILSVLVGVFNIVYKKTSNQSRYEKEIIETLPKETDEIVVRTEGGGNKDSADLDFNAPELPSQIPQMIVAEDSLELENGADGENGEVTQDPTEESLVLREDATEYIEELSEEELEIENNRTLTEEELSEIDKEIDDFTNKQAADIINQIKEANGIEY